MSFSEYKRISEYFHLVDYIHLQGWGEPLLHPNLLDMIQIAKSKKCKTSLTTNGILLTLSLSEELIKQGMDIIAVSISGATKETHENIRCGSNFEKIINNIRTMVDLKLKQKTKTPKLVLSFLMTKTNIKELPEAVTLAKDLSIDELVATNLDYIPTQAIDDLKAFSCSEVNINHKNSINIAMKKANKLKIPFRIYSLELEELVMCEMNPLQIVFISFDGCISPCVYLNLAKEGSIPRIFCGSRYEIEQLCFGSILERDLMEIWKSISYSTFRKAYNNRFNKFRNVYRDIGFEIGTLNKIRDVEESIANVLSENPLPEICRTCYKAFNI